MLGIFAYSFMTATRTGTVPMRPAPPEKPRRKKQWLPESHWWRQSPRDIDPNRI